MKLDAREILNAGRNEGPLFRTSTKNHKLSARRECVRNWGTPQGVKSKSPPCRTNRDKGGAPDILNSIFSARRASGLLGRGESCGRAPERCGIPAPRRGGHPAARVTGPSTRGL